DDEHALFCRVGRRSRFCRLHWSWCRFARVERQEYGELRSLADALAPCDDRSVMEFNDIAHERKADAKTLARTLAELYLQERLEDARKHRRLDADAVVFDRNLNLSISRADGELYLIFGMRVLRGVRKEVRHDLLYADR